MSRSIIQSVLNQLEANELTTFMSLEFTDGSSWYRYTDLDVPVYAPTDSTTSHLFTPIGFRVESITYSTGNIVDEASLEIDNINQVMTSLFAGGTMQGNEASLYCGVMDANDQVLDLIKVFEGLLDSFDLDERSLKLKISSYFSQWSQETMGKHSSSCRWKKFKGAECRYAGAGDWCDRSYTRCQALNNIVHFGGFRFLPDLENKSIWWGPTPEERRALG